MAPSDRSRIGVRVLGSPSKAQSLQTAHRYPLKHLESSEVREAHETRKRRVKNHAQTIAIQ